MLNHPSSEATQLGKLQYAKKKGPIDLKDWSRFLFFYFCLKVVFGIWVAIEEGWKKWLNFVVNKTQQ